MPNLILSIFLITCYAKTTVHFQKWCAATNLLSQVSQFHDNLSQGHNEILTLVKSTGVNVAQQIIL